MFGQNGGGAEAQLMCVCVCVSPAVHDQHSASIRGQRASRQHRQESVEIAGV